VDQASAQKLVAALDLEIARRQAQKDAVEEARWLEEHGDDPLAFLALNLSRLADRLEKWDAGPKLPEPKLSAEERELQDRRFGELMDGINGIIEDLERLARHEEAEASGVPRRRSVILGPRVRSVAGLGREPKPTGENGKSKKLSRTEVWKEQQEEQAAARQAMLPPRPAPHQPDQKPVDETIIKFGTVQHYDSRSMSGVVSIGGGPGRLELPFSASEIMRAGITALHPSQSVECQITRRLDGSLVVTEIKLSVGERAAAIAELERQAQAAEENYRIELMRRGLH
jgi:hypothetical protein